MILKKNPPHIKCRDKLWWVGISNTKRKGEEGGDIPSSSSSWHTIICGGWGLVIK